MPGGSWSRHQLSFVRANYQAPDAVMVNSNGALDQGRRSSV